MNPRNISLIIRREVSETIFKRTFLLSIFIPLTIMLLMICIGPAMDKVSHMAEQNNQIPLTVGVLSSDLSITQAWDKELKNYKLSDGAPKYILQPTNLFAVSLLPGGKEITEEDWKKSAQEKVRSAEWDSFVVVNGDITEAGSAELFSKPEINFTVPQNLYNSLQNVVRQARLQKKGLDPELVRLLNRGITWNEFEVQMVPVQGQDDVKRSENLEQKILSTIACVMLMFFLVYGTSEAVLKGVVAEKATRMIEILLSSLSPTEILTGKILAFYIIGILQFFIWIGLGWAVTTAQGIEFPATINTAYFLRFLLFLTTGYLFFSSIFAVLGSMIQQDSEAQMYLIFISLLLSLPLFFSFAVITQPNWLPVRIACYIPFFAPMLMAMRMAATTVPWWEISLVALNLVFWSVMATVLAARIFRTTLLMTGKSISPRELWRWVRYSDSSSNTQMTVW